MRIRWLAAAVCLALVPLIAAAQRPQSDDEREKARVRIGMTREQQVQIEALWADTDRQNREVGMRMGELRKQLQALYDTYEYDRGQASAIRKEIYNLYRKRSQIYGDNQDKLRKILTREQFERMTGLVKEQREQHRKDWESRRRESDRRRPDRS